MKGKGHLEELGIEEIIILEETLKIYAENLLTGFIWLRIWTSGGLF
jgi:hypothetical protein